MLIPVVRKPDETVEANLKLIAAAPDLLEALENLLYIANRYYRSLPDDGEEQDHLMASYIGPAESAIAKATGSEPS